MLRDLLLFALKEQTEGSQRQARSGAPPLEHDIYVERALKGARRKMVRYASVQTFYAPFQGADIFTIS